MKEQTSGNGGSQHEPPRNAKRKRSSGREVEELKLTQETGQRQDRTRRRPAFAEQRPILAKGKAAACGPFSCRTKRKGRRVLRTAVQGFATAAHFAQYHVISKAGAFAQRDFLFRRQRLRQAFPRANMTTAAWPGAERTGVPCRRGPDGRGESSQENREWGRARNVGRAFPSPSERPKKAVPH